MRDIILASNSARRKDLLEFLGVPFAVIPSDFPEEDVKNEDFATPKELVETLAAGKAFALADRHPDAIIIGADTMVFLNGIPYGKPKDLDDARRILEALRGQTHQVYTAICVLDTLTGERDIQSVMTDVTFFHFSDDQLERYIDTSEPLGKAGAYAIQMGAKAFVQSVDGSLSNVVGLPLRETANALEMLGVPIDVDVEAVIEEHFTYRK